jgi:hypothetical protein
MKVQNKFKDWLRGGQPMQHLRRKSLLLVVACLLMGAPLAMAQDNIYKLHALFLYNFTKHVQWNEVGEIFTIGVYGSDLALSALKENLNGKKFGTKDIRVIRVAGLGDVKASQILFTPKSNKGQIMNLLSGSDLSNVLLVTEDDMIGDGADISFIIASNKLNFKISKTNIESKGLKVSGALLSLGQAVN